jgi:hypothetical protein
VTLTATPAGGSTFAGWSGACTGVGSCVVTMSGPQTATAAFTTTSASLPTLPLATVDVAALREFHDAIAATGSLPTALAERAIANVWEPAAT